MPVMHFRDLPEDPHVQAVGMFLPALHPTEGPYQLVRRPVSYGGAPFEVTRHAPRLGEHTEEVLAEAGMSKAALAEIVLASRRAQSERANAFADGGSEGSG